MNVVSTFSGVGGIDLGLERAGMRVVAQCEFDEWKRGVLAAHWPHVACSTDVRLMGADGDQAVDLLCGGFPCQDLSVAGKRAGLAGARSGLFHEFARIADALRPTWLLVENVPGLLSSNDGRDFGVVLGTLADLGYSVAWRVLDARYFGVPQRRRRVFVVGHLGADDGSALRALCESCIGSPPAGLCSWQVAASGTRGGAARRGLLSHALTTSQQRLDPNGETFITEPVCGPLRASHGRGNNLGTDEAAGGQLITIPTATTLTSGGHPGSNMPGRHKEDDVNLVAFHQIQDPISSNDHSSALGRKSSGMGIAFAENSRAELVEADVHQTLTKPGGKPGQNMAVTRIGSVVRRLTPIECERLMGWPDGWTAPEGVKAPDSRRYAACGDGVVANVAEWIGRRIMAVEHITRAMAGLE